MKALFDALRCRLVRHAFPTMEFGEVVDRLRRLDSCCERCGASYMEVNG